MAPFESTMLRDDSLGFESKIHYKQANREILKICKVEYGADAAGDDV